MIGAAVCACPALVELGEAIACTGLPRASERRSRVRMMYSLRHEARAVRRVKARRSDRTTAWVSLLSSSKRMLIESGPGKKWANALRHACGPVTKSWNRFDTNETEVKSVGAK